MYPPKGGLYAEQVVQPFRGHYTCLRHSRRFEIEDFDDLWTEPAVHVTIFDVVILRLLLAN